MEVEYDMTVLLEKVKKAAEDLEENGYAIIPAVFTKEECATIREKMWEHLKEISKDAPVTLTPDLDYAKMAATQLLPHKHGIIESWRFNHVKTIREVRRDRRILWIFALLYGTDQLTGSMDRVNFKFPGRPYKSKGTWPHVDQHAAKLDRITIQSYITFLDCEEDSPGNRFYKGSHKIFADFFKAKRNLPSGDWNILTEEEKKSLPLLCPLVKPTYEAGSMLLWDSRTVHDPDDGRDFKQGRFVIYVCFNRLWEKQDNEQFLAQKKNAFLDCRATSHAPIPQSMFAKCPRSYGKDKGRYDEIPKDRLGLVNPDEPIGAEEYLFGFKRYQGKEGLLLEDKEWQHKHGVTPDCLPLLSFVSPFDLTKRKKESVETAIISQKKSRSK